MRTADRIFIGIKGQVVALDRTTGQEIWSTRIKGSSFVNLVLDGDQLLAAANGELFCLDPTTGTIRWTNKLPGYGLGLMSIATANAPSGSIVNSASEIEAQQAAASGAVIAGA